MGYLYIHSPLHLTRVLNIQPFLINILIFSSIQHCLGFLSEIEQVEKYYNHPFEASVTSRLWYLGCSNCRILQLYRILTAIFFLKGIYIKHCYLPIFYYDYLTELLQRMFWPTCRLCKVTKYQTNLLLCIMNSQIIM